MPAPAVSVVMSVFNGLPYVESAVRSILDQTLRDIELIVVDDASSDGTPGTLSRMAAADSRLRVVRRDTNNGPAAGRNRAMELAQAPLIAIMDSDDISLPERLARQKALMDARPDLLVVGTSIEKIDASDRVFHVSRRPRDAVELRWLCRFQMPFNHPSVMFRATLPDGSRPRYDPEMLVAQDYDLMARILMQGDGLNLPDLLLRYRVHPTQISARAYQRQSEWAQLIARRMQGAFMPADLAAAIEPFNRSFLDFTEVGPGEIFAAMRRVVTADARSDPAHRRFYFRHGAQLIATALHRNGASKAEILGAFLAHGRDFALPLLSRFLETRRVRSSSPASGAAGPQPGAAADTAV